MCKDGTCQALREFRQQPERNSSQPLLWLVLFETLTISLAEYFNYRGIFLSTGSLCAMSQFSYISVYYVTNLLRVGALRTEAQTIIKPLRVY
jgi:hypothetical protein